MDAGSIGVLAFVALIIVVPIFDWLVFEVYTKRLERMASTGDRDAIIRVLENVLKLPSVMGKANARNRLAHQYLVNKQYEQAIEQYRHVLRVPLRGSAEAKIRANLAECLEALGKTDEAAAERGSATTLAYYWQGDLSAAQAKAQLLERDNRYAEACRILETALPHIPPEAKRMRSQFLARLTTTSFNAGRVEEAAAWGEAGLKSGPTGVILDATRSMTALAYKNLGDLDKAEALLNLAFEDARADGRTEQAARIRASIAEVHFLRGAIDEALAIADEALAMGTKFRGVAYIMKFEAHKALGRYEEALAALDASIDPPALAFKVSYVKRHNGVNLLGRAHICAEMREPERAQEFCLAGARDFANDVKMTHYCDAMYVWIMALLGDNEAAAAQIAHVEAAEMRAGTSRTTLIDVLLFLCRAAREIGDFETAERLARRLLTLKPYPVQLPQLHYLLGDSLRGRGDLAGARQAYQEAAAFTFGTRYERDAADRLREMPE
jgi:tetratricopeptide (TPR) repeat protein